VTLLVLLLINSLSSCHIGRKSSNGLFLAVVGAVKFGFGALLLFGTLATTLGDLLGCLLKHFSSYMLQN